MTRFVLGHRSQFACFVPEMVWMVSEEKGDYATEFINGSVEIRIHFCFLLGMAALN